MSEQAVVPIIDISALFGTDSEKRLQTAKTIGKACADIGFFIIVGHQVDPQIVEDAWTATKGFFDSPLEQKTEFVKPQQEYPFGYNPMGDEVLSAGKAAEQGGEAAAAMATSPPDLKEMFSIGPKNPAAGFPARLFPRDPAHFASAWDTYYDTLATLATHILRAFALALDLEEESFFEQFVDHHASALRAIHYPTINTGSMLPGQLRASAHTDYGTITILKSDGPGLQVSKDKSPPTWYDVPHVEGAFIINLGDLMRRWTNDRWLSTLHRVVIPSTEVAASWGTHAAGAAVALTAAAEQEEGGGGSASADAGAGAPVCMMTKRRQSMAFFHNINKDAEVSVILRSPDEVAKHAPIIAGDFLMQKHLASMKAAAK
jgi:isopenicillin N synthase-like dioxygenase